MRKLISPGGFIRISKKVKNFVSTPTPVDVSANGMAKKYSRGSIRTSYGSSGLLTGSRLNKKTLLGE
jgi:hypothetical protein